MFRALYKDPKFVGAQTVPPDQVMVIMEDGLEYYTTNETFRSIALIDWYSKQVKGTPRG